MTLKDLKIELEEIGVLESSYSINDGLKEDAYIIDDIGGIWKCFYYERGEELGVSLFKTETEAYQYILNQFKKQLSLMGRKKF